MLPFAPKPANSIKTSTFKKKKEHESIYVTVCRKDKPYGDSLPIKLA